MRAILENINDHVRPVYIPSLSDRGTPVWNSGSPRIAPWVPSESSRSRSQKAVESSHNRRSRSRSRSPHARIDRNRVQRSRSPLLSIEQANRRYSHSPDDMSITQDEQMRSLSGGLAQLRKREKEVVNSTTKVRKIKRNANLKEGSVMKDMESKPPQGSTTPDNGQFRFAHFESSLRGIASAPIDVDIYEPSPSPTPPARESSFSPTKFHATMAKLRKEMSPVPHAKMEQKRRIENQKMELRWRELQLDRKAKEMEEQLAAGSAKKNAVVDLTMDDE